MSDTLDRIKKYKAQIEKAKALREQKKGALKETLIRLKKEYKLSGLAEIEARLKEIRPKLRKLRKRRAKALRTFERVHGKKLKEMLSDA